MADVAKGIIDIEINTGNAAAQLKALQQQINAFTIAVNKNNKFQSSATAKYTTELQDLVNASRFFTAETVKMKTSAGALDATLRKGQATLGQFFNAKFNRNSALFAETMGLAAERSRTLQTQFIATTGASRGMQEALAIRPLAAFSSEMAIATQRSQILTSMFKQGTTQLINFGKNVQWAGRQLMVGFTLPLTVFGSTAGKTFMELERQAVAFKKVYGDIFTTPAELQGNMDAVMALGKEYTKYGIAVKDTVGLAAQAAAAGRRNKDLTDAVTQATRLSTLGQMDQNQALDTTIALQSAFRLSGQELADTVNFLNMVENQTVVSLQDLAAAIPRVAPVIKGLGGDVKDMAVFLAAMQEGGVSAEQGANALKSGLGSLINPTKQAKEMLAGFNINLDAIVQRNRGDLMGTVMDFATALQTLDEFSRQQALEQVFGKFQYARLGALFENIVRDGSQASQVIDTMAFSSEQLRQTAERELSVIEQSFGVQLTAAIEKFKLAIAPIGQLFVQLAIPVVNFLTKIVEGFNNLPDFSKKFIALATIITGLVIPAGTMFFGLLMNLSGTLAKLLQSLGIFSKGLMKGGVVGGIQAVTQSMKYMSLEEIDAAIAAKQLGSATMSANDAFRAQVSAAEGARAAVRNLGDTYSYLINRMAEAASLSKFTFAAPGTALQTAQARSRNIKGAFPRRFATGGQVPGTGNQDTVPAMLTPGEFVVTKDATRSIGTKFLERLNMGGVAGYFGGGDVIENKRNLDILAQEAVERSGIGVRPGKLSPSQARMFGPPLELTHLGSGGDFVKPSGLTGGQEKIFNKVGKFATQQEGFTAFLPRSINQALRNSVGSGVKASDLLSYLRNTPAGQTFGPLDQVLGKTGRGTGSDRVQAAMVRKLELMVKTGRGDELLFDKHVGPIYQRAIKKLYPETYSLLKRPMQWRADTKEIYNKIGISKPTDIESPRTITNLRAKGLVVLNKGKKLAGDITKDQKSQFIKNLPKGSIGVYRNKSGKVNFIGRDGSIVGASYTGGANIPAALSGLRNILVTKNKGGDINSSGTQAALLTPGEFVVNKDAAARNRPFLDALNAGKVKNFQQGTRKERNQRYQNITGRTVGQARMAAIGSRVGGGIGGAAFTGFLAGPALQSSSNQAVSAIGKVVTGASIAASAFQVLGPVLRVLATRLPFLTNPVGLVITAFMATSGLLSIVVNKELKKVADAGAAMTRAMYGSTENIEAMAESFGRTTTRQRLAETRASRAGGGISAEAQQFSTQYIQSDAGKKLLADIEKVRAAGGDAALAIRNQVSKAVVAGAITPDEAEAIAKDIGLALNDQSLAIDAVGKISKLFGPNGELLENNILQIAAEISPKFNLSDIITLAQQQVEEGNFISKLFGIEENQVRENVANNINEILKGANENIAASMDVLTTQYEDGEISFTKYQEGIKQQTDLINKNTTKAIDSFAQYLGKTDAELKNLYDRNKFGNLRTQESKAVVKFFDDQRKAAEQSLVGVGQGFESSIVDAVFTGLADGDVLKATEYFNQLTTGNIDKDLVDKIVKALTDKGLIEAANAFRNYITPQVTSRAPDGVKPPVTFQEEDPPGSGGEKSKIQILEESIKQTKEYSAALSVLVKRGLSPEAAANLDAATAIELVKKKRLDLVKAVNQQAAAQRVLQNIVKGEDERQVDILEAQTDAIDANIEAVQDQIDAINKLNDADQRQLTVRNKALEDLSKKEENVNKSYNARIDALNRVKEANAQVAQQEKNRLDLASALTSGDIAAAAQAALTMTEDFAQGQIDNTQAELELQRQREIDALTTSVNGQLLTRQQIESQIDSINQRMYERDLQTWPLQDQIKNLESQREVIARQIEATQLRIRARQIEEEARVGRLVGYYKDIAKYINQAANRKYDPTAANAGGVIKKAFGGFLKYTSNEPAPGMAMGGKMKKYAVGNIVPGLGNTDRVPALLTPGEFVVRKSVAAENMDMLKALNGDVFPSIKGTGSSVELGSVAPTTSTINNTPVYTYNVNVNVPNTDASPEEIANVVVGKLRRMTDTNLRSNRL